MKSFPLTLIIIFLPCRCLTGNIFMYHLTDAYFYFATYFYFESLKILNFLPLVDSVFPF